MGIVDINFHWRCLATYFIATSSPRRECGVKWGRGDLLERQQMERQSARDGAKERFFVSELSADEGEWSRRSIGWGMEGEGIKVASDRERCLFFQDADDKSVLRLFGLEWQ
ncbi:hypothetical protein TNCV_3094701 [Trichonephila clavipes]|nr:hypothetical protein TNCV_3094701 [Trichonephila clavipes]